MASRHSFGSQVFACLVTLAAFLATNVEGTYWTVTSYYEFSLSTTHYGTYSGTDYDYTYTDTLTVKPTVTPTATPASTSTYINTYEDVTIVYVYLDPGSVNDEDIETTYTYDNYYTEFVEQMVFTAPASCPTPFTFTTYVNVYPPYEVYDQLNVTGTSTELYTGNTYVHTYLTEYLVPGQMPASITASRASVISSIYLDSCYNPVAYATATATGSSSSSGGGVSSGGDDDYDSCYYYYSNCSAIVAWVIAIAVIIPTLFLFGFVESWFWFRNLMLGKTALRFGTVCWTLISLWVLCFTRKTPARTPEDQAALREKWNAMSGGTKFRLWWKWGFRHKYPVELLGADPSQPNAPTGVPPGVPGVQTQPVQGQAQPPGAPQMMYNGAQPYPGQVYYQPVGDEKLLAQAQVAPGQAPNGQQMYMVPGTAPGQQTYMVPVGAPGQQTYMMPQQYAGQPPYGAPPQGYPAPRFYQGQPVYPAVDPNRQSQYGTPPPQFQTLQHPPPAEYHSPVGTPSPVPGVQGVSPPPPVIAMQQAPQSPPPAELPHPTTQGSNPPQYPSGQP